MYGQKNNAPQLMRLAVTNATIGRWSLRFSRRCVIADFEIILD